MMCRRDVQGAVDELYHVSNLRASSHPAMTIHSLYIFDRYVKGGLRRCVPGYFMVHFS